MALFKILRGSKSNFESEESSVKNITDGYAYFIPETGKFYIDVVMPGEEPGENEGRKAVIGNSVLEYNEQGQRVNRVCINDTIQTEEDYIVLDCGTSSTNW